MLMEVAGMDATEGFEQIGHSDDAKDLLKTLYIGDLDPKVSFNCVSFVDASKMTRHAHSYSHVVCA